MFDTERQEQLITLTSDIVSAYVHKNVVPQSSLADLISLVHSVLARPGRTSELPPVFLAEPAVPVKKSIKPETIFCLECGKPLKFIRRHLYASHSLTPEQYREKWSLPLSYPMPAPVYAKERSRLAMEMGVSQKPSPTSVGSNTG